MIVTKLTPGLSKKNFFDRAAVRKAVSKAERKKLGAFGAFVRSVARNSMKKPGKKNRRPSPAGVPPRVRTGLLRKFLFFAYDFSARSVVIGPVKLKKRGQVPALHEYGGTQPIRLGGFTRVARYPARPYMQPAFEEGLARGASLWRDSIK